MVAVAASGAVLVASLSVAEKARRPFTIVRTHLTYQIESDQSVALEDYGVAVGMCVVSDQAAAIGVTAVPTPVTDLASDLWYLHQITFGTFVFASAVGFVERAGPESNQHVDSKAMRKVNDDQDVLLVAEGTGIGSGMILRVAGRLLVKEH